MTGQAGNRRLRDTAVMCLAVLNVPGTPVVCELDAGHLDQGVKHKSGCTRWGRPSGPEQSGRETP